MVIVKLCLLLLDTTETVGDECPAPAVRQHEALCVVFRQGLTLVHFSA